MELFVALLLIAALGLFLVHAGRERWNLQSLGLACVAGAMLLTAGVLNLG